MPPAAVGWTVLVAGLLTAVLTAAYATRLWLLAFRGRGAEAPDHGRQPVAMNAVLWVLAVPTVAFGLASARSPDWFDGRRPHPDPHHLRPRHRRRPRRRPRHLRRLAAHHRACAARVPLGAVAAHPGRRRRRSEAEAIATHEAVYGDIAGAPDPADPGRLLLGPLHRHAAAGFHLDALYTALFVRPVRAAASLVRFLDREVVDTYVRGAGGAAPRCSARPSAAPRPAMCRPTSARCSPAPSSWPSPPSSSPREREP